MVRDLSYFIQVRTFASDFCWLEPRLASLSTGISQFKAFNLDIFPDHHSHHHNPLPSIPVHHHPSIRAPHPPPQSHSYTSPRPLITSSLHYQLVQLFPYYLSEIRVSPQPTKRANQQCKMPSKKSPSQPLSISEMALLSSKLFSPNLFPRRLPREPRPPQLAGSKLSPPAAEIDERPTARIRRFKLWSEQVGDLRVTLLDPRRRGALKMRAKKYHDRHPNSE